MSCFMRTTALLLLILLTTCDAETIFLDNYPGVANNSTTYDSGTRTCGQGSHRVFTDLDEAVKALSEADILYFRAGAYSRPSVGKYIIVHGNKVNYWTGVLDITVSGTPQKRKLVSAYNREAVIIQAKPGVNTYNPEPDDITYRNSSHFYPHPAIGIHGAYIDVVGFKTYGQVVITGHDVTLQGCDLGGGGPHMNQGQVVALNSHSKDGVYNIVIKNNKIHHSCWGESKGNGAAIMGYNFSCTIENNEFRDNYGADVRIKDAGGQQGRDVIIRYNFFGPTSLDPKGNTGTGGLNQDKQLDRILVYNNVFCKKSMGASVDGPPPGRPPKKGMFIFNNTFVNCGVDIGEWTSPTVNAHNNVFYHSEPDQAFYDIQSTPWSRLNSDHNLFFSTAGDTQWRHQHRDRASSLRDWQEYSAKDANSIWKDPLFVNPNGSDPQDFGRKADSKQIGDVKGSKRGPVCGAYVTGDEIIGLPP